LPEVLFEEGWLVGAWSGAGFPDESWATAVPASNAKPTIRGRIRTFLLYRLKAAAKQPAGTIDSSDMNKNQAAHEWDGLVWQILRGGGEIYPAIYSDGGFALADGLDGLLLGT
jgi:hypothetical protein